MTHTIAIEEAESQFAKLLSDVLAGDEVVLTDQEKPVARLPPVVVLPVVEKRVRIPGLFRGSMKMRDDFDEPLGDEFWFGQS